MRQLDEILQGRNLREFLAKAYINHRYWCVDVLGLSIDDAFHYEWCNLIDSKHLKDICVIAPRQHGKTEVLTVSQALRHAFFNSNQTIALVSSSAFQATKLLKRIREYIENNELLMHLKPKGAGVDKVWSRSELELSNGTEIFSSTLGPRVRGSSCHLVLCDDILRDDNVLSPYEIETRFNEIITFTLAATKGRLFLVGTPQTYTDLLHKLEKKAEAGDGWTFRRYRALKEDGQPLWSGNYTLDDIAKMKKKVGSISFAKEFMCNPMTDDTSLFPSRLILGTFDEDLAFEPRGNSKNRYVIGVDLARSAAASADYTVFTVLNCHDNGYISLAELIRQKGEDTTDQISSLVGLAERFPNSKIVVEKNNMGQTFIDFLMKESNLWVIPETTTKKRKEDMILHAMNIFEKRKFKIPRKTDFCIAQTDILINELSSFGIKKTKGGAEKFEGVGAHDDCVMSLALALWGSRDFWFSTHSVFH